MVVDGDDVPAGLEGGQVDLEDLDAVGQHEGDGVARLQAEGPQAVDDLVGPAQQLARLQLGAVGTDQGQVRRLLLRHRPEPEVGHRRVPPRVAGPAASATTVRPGSGAPDWRSTADRR